MSCVCWCGGLVLVQATGSASLDPAAIGVGEVERGEGWRWVELGGRGIIEAESLVDLAREPWTSLSSKLPWFGELLGFGKCATKMLLSETRLTKAISGTGGCISLPFDSRPLRLARPSQRPPTNG